MPLNRAILVHEIMYFDYTINDMDMFEFLANDRIVEYKEMDKTKGRFIFLAAFIYRLICPGGIQVYQILFHKRLLLFCYRQCHLEALSGKLEEVWSDEAAEAGDIPLSAVQ